MLYFKLYPFNYSSSLVVSHSYLCNWVNYCSIISQVIIYLKVLKCWISILNLALFCSTLPAQLAQHYCSLWTCLRLTLCWLGPRVALLVVDLFRLSQPFLLCVKHLDSLCSLFSCLWRLSKYSYFRRTCSCKLLSSLPIGFPSAHFFICLPIYYKL